MKTKWSKSTGTKRISAPSAATSSTEDDEGEMQQPASSIIKRRALNRCTPCGMPLKGHVCQYQRTKPAPHYVAGAIIGLPRDHRTVQAARSGSIDNEAWTEVMAPAHILQDEVLCFLLQIAEQEQSQSSTLQRKALLTPTSFFYKRGSPMFTMNCSSRISLPRKTLYFRMPEETLPRM